MRVPPSRRADYPYFQRHTTRWADNDSYGHLNNVVHYMLFDTTVNQWLIAQSLLDPAESPAIGFVAETGCRYLSEMSYPSVITAGMRVSQIGRSSVRYELALFADDNDEAAAEGFFVHVYVDAETHRPCPIPEPTRAAMASIRKNKLEDL
ncbi:MAG: acyl-CoA thioesterase [Chelatococcus sp.]|jgi:acyl-CoA thioester hydrolase|uniref:acyl-CoA thioesterase n=1 Tax=unclassified Chelatococcus TaxID=2638111 RepID=UPI001BD034C0|nr:MULTISPECIES: thioesterase family protein [unclassified Chelatococcus]CAH1671932.1 putative 4-hydroxybenzoyl-CoA thioesterase [Hyphomicrobiales bacterium]MBS7738527.1 acyl-CoA thioesterase [Chelatococcus sp. HY11]MBX3536155.1 acyl-CoA thioesterase [Chelatococcus sp.]MBX3542931.1 acyl-CoA thioesterase [Chelatococcus sp.]MCO5076943.1 acyl-CoA thioesterase [Chelatococcus sp.]